MIRNEFFNISDNDFEIIIKLRETPKSIERRINIEEEYNKIYNELSLLSYLVLQKITGFFNSNSKTIFFDYFSYNNIEQANMLENTFDKIKSIIEEEIKKDLDYEYKDITSINLLLSNNVGYPPEKYDQINNKYHAWDNNEELFEITQNNIRTNSVLINENKDSDIKFGMKDSNLFTQIINNKNILKILKQKIMDLFIVPLIQKFYGKKLWFFTK